ncbi:hypothetical protein Peur_067726 [Populus x canadensis]
MSIKFITAFAFGMFMCPQACCCNWCLMTRLFCLGTPQCPCNAQWAMHKKERWAAIETANFYFAFCYAEQFE